MCYVIIILGWDFICLIYYIKVFFIVMILVMFGGIKGKELNVEFFLEK